jgi:DNA polymerase (family 10)
MESYYKTLFSRESEITVSMSLPHALEFSDNLLEYLKNKYNNYRFEISGQIRRQCDEISSLVIVSTLPDFPDVSDYDFPDAFGSSSIRNNALGINMLELIKQPIIPIYFVLTTEEEFVFKLWETTGSKDHVLKMIPLLGGCRLFENEKNIYKTLNANFTLPLHREIQFENVKFGDDLISLDDIKGSIHNHTTYSDGQNTVEEMALYAKNKLAMEYIAICDHSVSTYYGMTMENILRQHEEIDELNKKLFPFSILKGIEVDILEDGSLDYNDEILKGFDIVVASIHRGFNMTKEQATTRICRALENKHVNILGHPQNRKIGDLRNFYEVDFDKIIEKCKHFNVAIELNANPARLDVSWKHINKIIEAGVFISINPDAHSIDDLENMRWGVLAAQKGGCPKDNILNTFNKDKLIRTIKNE